MGPHLCALILAAALPLSFCRSSPLPCRSRFAAALALGRAAAFALAAARGDARVGAGAVPLQSPRAALLRVRLFLHDPGSSAVSVTVQKQVIFK